MKSHVKMIALILLIGYTMLLTYWMIWGFGRTTQPEISYNLVPFTTMASYFPIRSLSSLINIVGNIAVFVPFGVLIPLAFQIRFRKMLAYFLTGLFVLEMTQLISRRGSLDVDDFILNSIGFTMGYGLIGVIMKSRGRQP
ncbi:antibiotic resistance protein VanZ [Paenibacillus sp. LC231]|uniref:VanZ family protein n=1 Tax=Paenibacillus sp. LC231 TaxID=1120679 RepID=UPI0008DD7AE9|nr:VanZ family protein [Paenibacillus sp. LC231]OIB02445.1 antibiotic resistance protein VanZ [Paenibacillus sp. LC231]